MPLVDFRRSWIIHEPFHAKGLFLIDRGTVREASFFSTGASSGIGLAIAGSRIARGDEVWGTSRDPARLSQLSRLHSIQFNLSEPDSINAAFNAALAEAGHFDVVINKAPVAAILVRRSIFQ